MGHRFCLFAALVFGIIPSISHAASPQQTLGAIKAILGKIDEWTASPKPPTDLPKFKIKPKTSIEGLGIDKPLIIRSMVKASGQDAEGLETPNAMLDANTERVAS